RDWSSDVCSSDLLSTTRLRSASPELPNAASTNMNPPASANTARMAVRQRDHTMLRVLVAFGTLWARPGSRPAWARPRRSPQARLDGRAQAIAPTHIRTRSIQNCGPVRPDHSFIPPTDLPLRIYTQ